MVRPDVDVELSAPATRVAGRIRFAIATRSDDAAIRRLLRETPMHGAISLTFEREPDYFLGANIGSGNDHIIVAYDGNRLACMGRCTIRTAWVNGRVQRTGYLAELRLAADARSRFDTLREGYRFFRALQEVNPAEVYFTSIADDNLRARRLLERGLPGMPRYRHIGDLTTLLISTRSRLNRFDKVARLDLKSPNVRATDPKRVEVNPRHLSVDSAPIEELAAFFNEAGSRYQFAPAWTSEALQALANHDLTHESFVVIRENGAIVAAAALWDQRRFRQTVVRAYAPLLRHTRGFINLFGHLSGYPPLPAPGDVLAHAFLSPLAIRVGYEHLLENLVSRFCRRALERGLAYLTLALPSQDPRVARVQRRFRTRAYRGRIYRVEWTGLPRLELDRRNVLPEVALL